MAHVIPAMVIQHEKRERSCENCPSRMGASCGALGIPILMPGWSPDIIKTAREKIASECKIYGIPDIDPSSITGEFRDTVTPKVIIPVTDGTKRAYPVRFSSSVYGCSLCENFQNSTEFPGSFGVCLAKGVTITPANQKSVAGDCDRYASRTSRSDHKPVEIKLQPHYDQEYLSKKAQNVTKYSHLPEGFDPTTYEGSVKATSEDIERGIRAWVKIVDQKTSNEVSLPIYRRDFFTDSEIAKIPNADDETMPGSYVDHAGLIFKVGVSWIELDETPCLIGEPGFGKGHPVDTKVLTPSFGWVKVGSLKPGDFVVGSDGLPTRVINVFPRGVLPINRVTMTDGSSVLVDDDHLWLTKISNKPESRWRTMSTRELANSELRMKYGYRWEIPIVEPVQYSRDEFPIEPYLLGVILANGSLTAGEAIVTTNDEFIINKCRALGAKIDERTPTPARRWKIWGDVWSKIGFLGLKGKKSAQKFIPFEYLHGSESVRRSLLAALLDCDGSTDGRHTHYNTMSRMLAKGVVELVQSLGGTASVCTSKRDGELIVSIHMPVNPFSLPRKSDIWDSATHRRPSRRIKSINPEGSADVVCIQVEAADRLYVTENYIVTHNTELLRHIAWIMQLPFERITITASSEIDDLAGKFLFEENETRFEYGRLARAWGKPNVICLDEPNTGPNDVLQFIRPLIDNSKQLALDMNKGELIARNMACFLGLAMNPSHDYRNIGANPMADADNSRLLHLEVPAPPEPIERAIIVERIKAKDGWDIPEPLMNSVMAISRTLRKMSKEGEVPFSWGLRVQIKVARLLRWFDMHDAYMIAMGSSVDPETQDKVIAVVKANIPEREKPRPKPKPPEPKTPETLPKFLRYVSTHGKTDEPDKLISREVSKSFDHGEEKISSEEEARRRAVLEKIKKGMVLSYDDFS